MTTAREAAKIMGESYIEWSRAKEKGDRDAMSAALDKAAAAAFECDDANEAIKLHTADKNKLTAQRIIERSTGSDTNAIH